MPLARLSFVHLSAFDRSLNVEDRVQFYAQTPTIAEMTVLILAPIRRRWSSRYRRAGNYVTRTQMSSFN